MYSSLEDEIEKTALMALEKPEDFGWWGRDDMFVTWGWSGISQNNSSNIVDRSNYQVIKNDLTDRYPDDFQEIGLGHWAVGHVDTLIVKILKDENKEVQIDNITSAFIETVKWLDHIRENVVADEMHLDQMAYEEGFEIIKDLLPDCVLIKESVDQTVSAIIEHIHQTDLGYIDFIGIAMGEVACNENDIITAAYELGFIDPDYQSDWDDICTAIGLPLIDWNKFLSTPENPDQLSLFDEVGHCDDCDKEYNVGSQIDHDGENGLCWDCSRKRLT